MRCPSVTFGIVALMGWLILLTQAVQAQNGNEPSSSSTWTGVMHTFATTDTGALTGKHSKGTEWFPHSKMLYAGDESWKSHFQQVGDSHRASGKLLSLADAKARVGDVVLLESASGTKTSPLVLIYAGERAFADDKLAVKHSFFVYPYVARCEYNTFPPRLHRQMLMHLSRSHGGAKFADGAFTFSKPETLVDNSQNGSAGEWSWLQKPKSLGNPSLFYQSKLWASGVTSRILRPTSGDSPRPLDAAGLRRLVEASTTKQKEYFHVVFTEIIDTKVQGDWRDSYGAKVQVFKGGQKVTFLRDGKKIDTLRGSTLPNFRPGKDKPKGWTYSVVQATCAFPTDLQGRFYTWARTKRDAQHDGAPCLRLTSKVPTVNIGSERANEMTLDELLLEFGNESKSGRYFQYASNILIHSGHKMTWRGSAGCLTIHPDDAELLLFMCLEGVKGTLEVNRGIYDKSSSTSRCY